MLLTDWPTAFAHVDCDAFYASCERARRPDLKHIPVCVLSNQEAFVVAKTYDAKRLGVTTAMSVRDARKIVPHAAFLPPDFAYYGQMSDRVFAILRRFSPDVELYSIDEGFIGMQGLRSLWRKSYRNLAEEIKETVKHEVGITVSIGISVTKTLAKIASESSKPDGVAIVPGKKIAGFLPGITIKDVPGIAESRRALLNLFKIETAADYANAPRRLIQRLMGKVGTDLWHELRGEAVFPLELEPKLPKSIARTASMGEITSNRDRIAAHLARHVTRLATELVTKRYVAGRIVFYLELRTFESSGAECRFPYPTASYFTLWSAAEQALDQLYAPGSLYRACGVIAAEISLAERSTQDLFGVVAREEREARLMVTVDDINRKYGKGTAAMLATKLIKHQRRTARFRYPVIVVR